ncbi:uncharacterized protein LOC110979432 isoform X2 [Acanthaster planci]|nr:uncharacterized protein LOC110979432 isoform X2 [Acanthaster planci]
MDTKTIILGASIVALCLMGTRSNAETTVAPIAETDAVETAGMTETPGPTGAAETTEESKSTEGEGQTKPVTEPAGETKPAGATEPAGETKPAGTTEPTGNGGRTTKSNPTEKIPTEKPSLKEFDGEFKIIKIDGADATFTAALGDSQTMEFKTTSKRVCDALRLTLKSSIVEDAYRNCQVREFRSGSIIADYRMAFDDVLGITADTLKAAIIEGFQTSNDSLVKDLQVDKNSFIVNAVSKIAGLSVGAIAGIAVGGVAALVLVIALIACVVVKVNGNSKVMSVEDAELQPSAEKKSEKSPSVASVS